MGSIWLGGESGAPKDGYNDDDDDDDDDEEEEEDPAVLKKRQRIEKLNQEMDKKTNKKKAGSSEHDFSDSDFEDEYDNFDDGDFEDAADDFFQEPAKNSSSKKKRVKFQDQESAESEEEEEEDEYDEDGSLGSDESENESQVAVAANEPKEDIYGRFIDQQGKVLQTEKYVPPAQRLKQLNEQASSENSMKLAKLSKQMNGLLNRLSTANINTIANQIMQIFYSNVYTRYDLIESLYALLNNSLIKSNCMTPIRLIVEHASLIHVLSANVGIELGATLLQKICSMINENLSKESSFLVENKLLDNLVLFLCNMYNFKLISANLIVDLFKNYLSEKLTAENLDKVNFFYMCSGCFFLNIIY